MATEQAAQGASTPADAAWLTRRETGTVFGLRLVLFATTVFGRTMTRMGLRLLALYYTLASGAVRQASRTYLEKVLGEPVTFGKIYRHVLTFIFVTVDRMFLLRGRDDKFELRRTGDGYLARQRDSGQGAILLGAHLGSYDAMRVVGRRERLTVSIVGYFHNARMINALLDSLDPEMSARVINIEPGAVDTVLAIRDRIDAGEMIAMAGDRIGVGERSLEVEFLGQPARFPTGPFVMASVLRCPVYLTVGIYEGGNRYHLQCEPFAERIELPRDDRDAALARYLQQYAARLDALCREAPYNWFNFYDFWKPQDDQPVKSA